VEAEPMEVSLVAEDILDCEIEDIDKEDESNPQLVVEYVRDIYNYLRHMETVQFVKPDYLAGQQVNNIAIFFFLSNQAMITIFLLRTRIYNVADNIFAPCRY
jgi:hypothetical protein